MALSDIFDYWDRAFLAAEIKGRTQTMSTQMAEGYEPPSMSLAPPPDAELCKIDGQPVRLMTFKGTGLCGELCRKVSDGEITKEEADDIRAARASAHPRA